MVANIESNIRQVGPYQLKARLAQNTITGVYHAVHQDTGAEVALRILYNADSPDAQRRFMERAQEIAALSHPAIVPVLDYGSAENAVYIAMTLMTGGTLKARFDKFKTIDNHERTLPVDDLPSLGEVADFLDRIASALDYLHEQDIVHYQIQPSNMLFDAQGNVFLADTGLARILKIVFSLVETNAINTHAYASPEQWNGEPAGSATDQYSLACLIYELVTGRPLFQSNSIFQLMNMHMNEFLIPPHHVRPGVPAGLTIVLVRALAKLPEERYASVGEFAAEFRKVITKHEGEPTNFFKPESKSDAPAWQHQALVAISEYDMEEALKLDDALRENGISTWRNEALRLGTIAWKSYLRQAIKDTGCVVLPLSENTLKSDWVDLMLSYARRFKKPVYGVQLTAELQNRPIFETVIDAREDRKSALNTLKDIIQHDFAV